MTISAYFHIPHQNHRVKRHHDFGLEKNKTRCRQALGENISKLITSGNVFLMKIFAKHLFTNKVIMNLHMLGASMKNKIWDNSKGRNIISPKLGGGGGKEEKYQGPSTLDKAKRAQQQLWPNPYIQLQWRT